MAVEPSRTELKVGVFVVVALTIATLIVFSLGSKSKLFSPRATYRAYFTGVSGLRSGAPVRIAGVDVGSVGDVVLRSDGRIMTELKIDAEYAKLIRSETRVAIGSKGLLGDKIIDITVGAGDPIPEWGAIPVSEAPDIMAIAATASDVIKEARDTVRNLREATGVLADEQFQKDIASSVHGVSTLMEMATRESGTVNKLMTDPVLADRFSRTVASAEVASAELARTSRNVRAITDEIRGGNGSVHELIYGTAARDVARNLARATGETANVLEAIRTGDGTLHDLIFEDSAEQIIANTEAITGDLRAVMADVRAGRGTIGGLLADPTIYEDVKRLVGNLERNEILRALVRYSIRQDEATPPPQVTAPSP